MKIETKSDFQKMLGIFEVLRHCQLSKGSVFQKNLLGW